MTTQTALLSDAMQRLEALRPRLRNGTARGFTLTANEDDILWVWGDKGIARVAGLLGVNEDFLRTWLRMRGGVDPKVLQEREQRRAEGRVFTMGRSNPSLRRAEFTDKPCPRCGGLVSVSEDNQGEVITCATCGYAGPAGIIQ